ncbi:hypothetical protein KC19_2G029800 [Ceratodon purpureus]|uniref:Uncharacterized protein n=1 Tax=Ceratodon purpureus TaxID=3225 RepID=A0A8T0IRK0_CERPU|nr:hypothetical protein KC19_2G029800 [Ceratodon purpureus]
MEPWFQTLMYYERNYVRVWFEEFSNLLPILATSLVAFVKMIDCCDEDDVEENNDTQSQHSEDPPCSEDSQSYEDSENIEDFEDLGNFVDSEDDEDFIPDLDINDLKNSKRFFFG